MKNLFFIFVLLVTTCLNSTIINIPADQPTIQAGIGAAVDADTVLVQPGTYVENINYNGKLITVASLFLTSQDTTYISQTIIDGNQNGSVVTFESGEDLTAALIGYTITNGSSLKGGGIYCNSSSPSLQNVIITGNSSYEGGGGLYCLNSSPSLTNVTISGNSVGGGWEWGYGGGICCENNSNPILQNVTISSNFSIDGGGGIYCLNSNPSLVDVTIIGNSCPSTENYPPGGGIYCNNSSPSLVNVTITGNSAPTGGGIYCYNNSNHSLVDVTISGNTAVTGGGIRCRDSNPILSNVTITDNFAYRDGGGIYCSDNSNPSLENVTITGNSAEGDLYGSGYGYGGGIYCNNSNLSFDAVDRCNIFLNSASLSGCDLYAANCPTIDVVVDTFTVLQPNDYFACPIDNFTFDILNAKVEQVDQDLYVSPDGSDDNSGLTVDDPLLTIFYALVKIHPSSTNHLTIHLSNGTYSPSGTGEIFPFYWRNYVNLSGNSEDNTILDAESLSRVMYFNSVTEAIINNVNIANGYAQGSGSRGGGIYCRYSSPSLVNVKIIGNTANWLGGGICCRFNSSPILQNVTLTDNSANDGGGIYCANSSNPSLINCIMWTDTIQEIYFSGNSDPNSITISYSDIEGGEAGIVTNGNGTVYWLEGNIDEDPLFVGTGRFPYSLLEDSSCIDAGNPDPIYYDPEDPGIHGYALYPAMGTIINDMGAYGGPNAIGWSVVGLDDNVIVQTPEVFLQQNYPNPFNPTTTINYSLKENTKVSLNIYNIKGQKVKQLVSDQLSAGQHSVVWNGTDNNGKTVSSGIYFYKLKTDNFEKTKKMILMK